MLLGWLTFTALLAASATPAVAGVTVKPAGRVRGQPEEELTLHCGDRQRSAGAVLFWHSPFGYHHPWDPHSSLDPVSMGRDGSLMISNTSGLHSGLYYCLRWRPEATTLWQYQLHVAAVRVRRETGPPQEEPEDGTRDWTEVRSEVVPEEEPNARPRRVVPPQDEPDGQPEVQSEDGETAGVSHGKFAAAVAASVLLTFVVGFSAGALARTHVLRCLAAVSKQLRSPRQQARQQARQPDATDHGSKFTTVTVPPAYENQAFEMGRVGPDDLPASTPPPAKPQRSFRYRQDEEKETTAYLEGCDHIRTAGGGGESEEGGKEENSEEGRTEEGEEEEEEEESEVSSDGGSQSETEEHREEEDGWNREKDGGSGEEKDGGSGEEKDGGSGEAKDGGSGEAKDGGSGEEKDGDEGETGRFSQTVDEGNQTESDEEKEREETSEDEEGGEGADGSRESDQLSEGGGDVSQSASRPARRIIRLYQYDEDGRRYGHLQDPPSEAPGPAPWLKQRSLSLTRLNAIMAAATASPLDTRGDGEEKPTFHMDI